LFAVFASSLPRTSPAPTWLAAFTRGTGEAAPTLVVAASPEEFSAVSVLRSGPETPVGLSTFDAGTADFAPLASALSIDAAARSRGGHFGIERGRRLVPEQG
jgi:hypothetical protein